MSNNIEPNNVSPEIFSEKDSIRVINQMIAQARGKLHRGEGKYFLLWGYLISLASIVHFMYINVEWMRYEFLGRWLWLGTTVLGGLLTLILALRGKKQVKVKTYVGSVSNSVWLGFGACVIAISLLLSGNLGIYIYPSISFVYTYALFMSAKALRFRFMYISIFLCILAVVAYRFVPPGYFPLLMAFIMIAGNIVPGHVINLRAKANV